MTTPVLALDLASRTGFCVGVPGDRKPLSGSIRFASAGASHEAIFAAAYQWTSGMVHEHKPSTVVWEAPMPTSFNRGSSNVNTTTLLYGLPAVIGAAAYRCGVYDIRKASTKDVRNHFIGSNPKRVQAKELTIRQCRVMGWPVADDNEADAIAVWSFMCSILEPKLAVLPTPMFGVR
jgi:hypothetical protein